MRIQSLQPVALPSGVHKPELLPLPADAKLIILSASFNAAITSRLVAGAVRAARESGISDITFYEVPGALEIPVLLSYLVQRGGYHGATAPVIVVIGCVIRGATDHYLHVCTQSIAGVQELAIRHALPLGNAILTLEDDEQAIERSGPGDDNKGYEAAQAAIYLKRLFRMLAVVGLGVAS